MDTKPSLRISSADLASGVHLGVHSCARNGFSHNIPQGHVYGAWTAHLDRALRPFEFAKRAATSTWCWFCGWIATHNTTFNQKGHNRFVSVSLPTLFSGLTFLLGAELGCFSGCVQIRRVVFAIFSLLSTP
jgi:hypothetical protein